MAGSVSGIYAVFSMIQALLQANLDATLAAIETDEGTSYSLTGPDSTLGYQWGSSTVPQRQSHAIQIYALETDTGQGLVKANGAKDQTHRIAVRYYYLAHRNDMGPVGLIIGRAVEKILNEGWHNYSTNPAKVIWLQAVPNYRINSLRLNDQAVPGARGAESFSGRQVEVVETIVEVKQRVQFIVPT